MKLEIFYNKWPAQNEAKYFTFQSNTPFDLLAFV
jgi:hypothetical protein